MLTVVGNWLYILFTTFCLGYGFSWVLERCTGYRPKKMDSVLMAGLIIATVYAQIFSLFGRVGAAAVLLLTVFCLVISVLLGRRMFSEMKARLGESSALHKAVIAALFVVWAYMTCQGYMHYDTDLYHAQSIRWLEEYGVVKGLANLHFRFAYNSSLFAVTALYSFKFLLGHSLHTVNGWMAFLLSLAVLDMGKAWKRKKLLLSDYACAAAVYYLTLIADEVVSPASDYITMCVVFYLVIRWLRQLEGEEPEETAPYALLCVVGVYAMSLKLSAGLILLLVIKPAGALLRQKKGKQILFYLSCGIVTAAPWLARNVLISGWLIYPMTALDFFPVDWKLPAWEVELDAAEIKTWGRALYNASKTDVPLKDWFGNWFRTTLSGTEKLLVLGDLAALATVPFIAVSSFVRKRREDRDYLLLMAALLASYVFWQLSAPLIRYGYAYVLLTAALLGGWFLQKLSRDGWVRLILILYGAYKLCGVSAYAYSGIRNPVWIWQEDYNTYEMRSYKIKGYTFYQPKGYSELTGYDPFPATPKKVKNVKLRGTDLSEGFRRKKK